MSKAYIMVKASDPFKDAVAAYAFKNNLTMSDVVRNSVADVIGYDLSGDDALEGRGRPTEYANDKQRKDAANRRARERAELHRKLVDLIMEKERIEGVEALEKYLKDRGISIEDEDEADISAA